MIQSLEMPKVAAVSFNLPWVRKIEPVVDENYEETDVEEAKVCFSTLTSFSWWDLHHIIELFQANGKGPKAKPNEEDILSSFAERAMVAAGLFKINPVTKTGQRLYMMHMLLLPFLPILALIIQNSTALHDVLEYQKEVTRYE